MRTYDVDDGRRQHEYLNQPVKRILLVTNPAAGRERAQHLIRLVGAQLQQLCAHLDIVHTQRHGQGVNIGQWAREQDFDRVVIAAGDGTLNEVANGLIGSNIPIAVIPLGTGNVFASNFRIPTSIPEACRVAVSGRVIPIDVGQVNHRYFLCVAGFGFDAHVVYHVQPGLKRRLRAWAYVLMSAGHLFRYRQSRIKLNLDGKERIEQTAWLTVVGNVPLYAWRLKLTRFAHPNDGLLDVCIFPAQTKLDYIRQAFFALAGYHLRWGDIIYRRVCWLEMHSDPPVPIQVDGEPMGKTPAMVRIIPRALRIVVPKSYVSSTNGKQPR